MALPRVHSLLRTPILRRTHLVQPTVSKVFSASYANALSRFKRSTAEEELVTTHKTKSDTPGSPSDPTSLRGSEAMTCKARERDERQKQIDWRVTTAMFD
jgi:hypothetical protein